MQDGNILIITNINRAQSGDYICEAKNQHGQGLSKTLNLKVRGKSMNHTLTSTDTQSNVKIKTTSDQNIFDNSLFIEANLQK